MQGYSWLMPLIGAAIGWFTNFLAVKLLFRPLEPIEIPLLKIKFQGVLPRRRNEIAAALGAIVARRVFSSEDLVDRLLSADMVSLISEQTSRAARNKLDSLAGFLPTSLLDELGRKLGELLEEQMSTDAEDVKSELTRFISEEIDVSQMVEQELNSLDLIQVERLILSLVETELRYIQVMGGVLGFIIGTLQFFIAQAT